jgi:hypothetical protein
MGESVGSLFFRDESMLRYALQFLVMFGLYAVCSSSHAANTLENPHEAFRFTKVHSNNITVTLITTKNVQATCNVQSKKRGFGGFSEAVEACSFWDSSSVNNKCTVVLPEVTNFHTIGHEVRHCFQGNWHK